MSNDILNRLNSIITDTKKDYDLKEDSLEGLLNDSLDVIKFVVKVEEEFDIYLDVEHISDNAFKSKQFIVELISELV
ncbi:hypothetical protein N473_17760 [Pseudoalteromonas luteoviolacea CPMOR-1]|uniref:Carrier domain-containing protein n=1 Tax=Pseudoalteromonas luteoviolacea CPMOR-1 TaxID=1365248 RepID=A0A167KU70_9GAMM|nr:hypothetical protein [Pseudoalteromonas luteoviolacea]KZN63275.1 hypothetical protein N473_17760 [Pseudoalteromonas luteoviolacea CPMOR-1]